VLYTHYILFRKLVLQKHSINLIKFTDKHPYDVIIYTFAKQGVKSGMPQIDNAERGVRMNRVNNQVKRISKLKTWK